MSYIFTNTCIPNQLIKHIVQALVLTLLDYCSSERNMTRLQVARNEVAHLVLRCPDQTNARTMNHHLAWLSVESRMQYSLICFIKKLVMTKTLEILHRSLSFFPDNHFTRQMSECRFSLLLCRTNLKQKTLHHRAMAAWNKLPHFLVLDNNTVCFKKKLKLFLFTQER